MEPTTQSFFRLGGTAEVVQRVFAQKRFIASLGPQVIIYPMILASAVSLAAAQLTEDLRLLLLAVLGLGTGLFTNAFVQLKRKRTIENCPTSNIGTMAMGEVEVTGSVRRKYLLRSPFTHTECVACRYKVYSEVRTRNGLRNVLRETNTVRGSILDSLLGPSPSRFGGSRKAVESVIPAGRRLYIIGYAHRVIMSAEKKKKGLLAAIRRLKADSFLTEALKSLFAVSENYPELRADSGFLKLQGRISELENEIADRRELFNSTVNIYNIRIEKLPDVIVASALGCRTRELWQINPEHRADVKIKFSS